jgi:hypothetical protein
MMIARTEQSLSNCHSGMNISCAWGDGKRLPETKAAEVADTDGENSAVSQYGNITEDDDEVTGDDEDDMEKLHRKYLYPYHSELI